MRIVHRPLRRPPVRRSLATSGLNAPNGLGDFLGSMRKRSLRANERCASTAPTAPYPSEEEGARLSFDTSAAKQPTMAKPASGRKTCHRGSSPRDVPAKL